MAKRSKEGFWDKFSRTGVILILLYVMFIILGFAVRLLFFSDKKQSSIIPQNQVVASAEGSSSEKTEANSENKEATNANILELKTDKQFLADFDPGKLDDTAAAEFDKLKADAAAEGLDIYIGSSYRDYNYQVTIYNNYCNLYGWEMADTFSARPGYSEHQTGLTIDCNTIDDAFGDTPEAPWLAEHCADYGFIIRFPDGKDSITGYKYEPWHIRYVGIETAKEINALGLTLEEYLGVNSEYTGPWEG